MPASYAGLSNPVHVANLAVALFWKEEESMLRLSNLDSING